MLEMAYSWNQTIEAPSNYYEIFFTQWIEIHYIIPALLIGSNYTYVIQFPEALSNPLFSAVAVGGVDTFVPQVNLNYYRFQTASTLQQPNIFRPDLPVQTRSMKIGSMNLGGHSVRIGFKYVG